MKKLTLNSLLVALAVALSFVERFIPLNLFVPIPGIKLGFANIVTMFALFCLDIPSAIIITVSKSLLASLLFGGATSLLYSLSGAFFAIIAMALLKLGYNKAFSLLGISIAGAAAHNTGQIIMASIMMKNSAIFAYLPILLLTSIVTGLITALITFNIIRIYKKNKRYI